MATNGTASESPAIGRVVAANETGIKFEGADSWANFSKFAVGIVAPSKGDVVSVTFDRGGFIRSIAPADGADIPSAPRSVPGVTGAQRDTTITRLAVLKAAAEYAASKPESKSGDVLKIAPVWERWVLREPDAGDDLTDAF